MTANARFSQKTKSRLGLSSALLAFGLGSVSAQAAQYDEAQVLSAEPIYRTVTHTVPRETCYDEEVPYTQRPRAGVTSTLVGAVIGGALGNAVGHKKRNKQVGTAVGALLGGSIGADISRHRRGNEVVRYRTERVCEVVEDVREEEQLTGYRVRYAYLGNEYSTRTRQHPGDTLRVRVRVTPAE